MTYPHVRPCGDFTGNIGGAHGDSYYKLRLGDLWYLLTGKMLRQGCSVFYVWGKYPDSYENWGWWRRRQERLKDAKAKRAVWQAGYDKLDEPGKSAVRHLAGAMRDAGDAMR